MIRFDCSCKNFKLFLSGSVHDQISKTALNFCPFVALFAGEPVGVFFERLWNMPTTINLPSLRAANSATC